MVEPIIYLPPVISFLVATLAYTLIIKTYMNRRYPEFRTIIVGFILYTMQPLGIIIVYIFGDSMSQNAVSYLGRFSLTCLLIGLVAILDAMKKLNAERYYLREKLLILFAGIGMGYVYRSFIVFWEEGRWNVRYSPENALLAYLIPLMWFTTELLLINYRGDNKTKGGKMITLGWGLVLVSMILVPFERHFRPDTFFYLIITGIGYMLIALALLSDPQSIIPGNLGGEYVIISEKKTGIPLMQTSLSDNHNQATLFSMGMTGVLNMLSELTGEPDIPAEIGYRDRKIMFGQGDRFICYYIGKKSIRPIRIILREILRFVEEKNINVKAVNQETIDEINELIREKLYFTTY